MPDRGWSIVRQVMSAGWVFLAAMILAYGVANLLQSAAAARTTVHHTFDPALLVRLAGQRTYLLGIGCQVLGFVLAFLARAELPLFLVQASVAAGLGVTALLGVLLLKWSLPAAEVVLLLLLMAGIAGLVHSAQPAHARPSRHGRREALVRPSTSRPPGHLTSRHPMTSPRRRPRLTQTRARPTQRQMPATARSLASSGIS